MDFPAESGLVFTVSPGSCEANKKSYQSSLPRPSRCEGWLMLSTQIQ